MNILIFNWRDLKHSWAGGGEIYVFELAKRWVKMGHKVTVFCSQDPYNKLKDEEEYEGIKIIRKGGMFSLYLFAPYYYLKYLRGKTDFIIDVHNGVPFFSPLFSRAKKIAFVFHVHKKQFFYEFRFPLNYFGYIIEKYIFPLIYMNVKVVAISKTTKKELISMGFNKNNVEVVYCGINSKKIKIKRVGKKFFTPTLLYLGRIKAYKRIDLLIDIFKDIVKFVPSAKLIIAGWGTEASGLVDKVMKSDLRRKIHVLGPVTETEKRDLLSRSWLFVNPSIGEGWSISVIEANFYGTPAVAFNVSGLSESIKHEHTGLLAKNKEDMIEKIIKLLSNKKYLEKLSKNAKKWSGNFSWEKASNEILEIMDKVKG